MSALPRHSEAELAWLAKRAARHHLNGATLREAVAMALNDLQAFYMEIAHAKTPRAKAAIKAGIERLWRGIRAENKSTKGA
ncbi:MAG: hypothetical protein WBY94_13935 [Polyangiaceae bacterium]